MSLIKPDIRRGLVFVSFWSFISLNLFSQSPNTGIRRYTVADGLSHNSVMAITQDKYGFMWFACFSGLNRFDGYEFQQFRAKDSVGLKSDFNRTLAFLYTDKAENLWFSSFKSGLYKFDFENNRFSLIEQKRKLNPEWTNVYKPFVDSHQNLWLPNSYESITVRFSGKDSVKGLHHLNFGKTWMDSLSLIVAAEDPSGDMWFGGIEGLYKLIMTPSDTLLEQFRFTHDRNARKQRDNTVQAMLWDSSGFMWVATNQGLKRLNFPLAQNTDSERFTPFKPFNHIPGDKSSITGSRVLWMTHYDKDSLLLRTDCGIEMFDKHTGKTRMVTDACAQDIYEIDQGFRYQATYLSRERILWVGTANGVLKINLNPSNIIIYKNDQNINNCLNSSRISSVFVENNGTMVIGTLDKGLNLGFPQKGFNSIRFRNSNTDPLEFNKGLGSAVLSISGIRPGKMFFSSGYFQELRLHNNSFSISNILNETFGKTPSSAEAMVTQMILIEGKLLVVYPESGVFLYDTITWKCKPFCLNDGYLESGQAHIEVTAGGRYFLRNHIGIYEFRLPLKETANGIMYPAKTEILSVNRNPTLRNLFLIQESNSRLNFWLSTGSDGLYLYSLFEDSENETGKKELRYIKTFNEDNGLSNNNINDLIEDKRKNIWVATDNGLNCINPVNNTIETFYTYDGLPDNKISYGSFCDSNGYLYFGTENGLAKFHPDSIKPGEAFPKVFITNFRIRNKSVSISPRSPLRKPVYLSKEIILRHIENFISFSFAALNIYDNSKTVYRYKMEGLNDEWIDAGHRRFAEYQNMPSGTYIFKVIATNNYGKWPSSSADIRIIIQPPFWQRYWFISLVLLLVTGGVIMYIRLREKKLKHRNIELELEIKDRTREVIDKQSELEHMRSRFYVNISHEFRTPLTIINSSVDELNKKENSADKKGLLKSIRHSSSNLLKLVNELLDLSKIEAGSLQLHIAEGNISETVKNLWEVYISEAERKNINYTFKTEPENITAWFDQEYISKIVNNLISNSLKFTENGHVDVRLEDTGNECILISVKDTGKGISPENSARVFERFYQVESTDSRSAGGTGIGLAIVKELAERHHGTIKLISRVNEGSEFVFYFPSSRNAYNDNEIETRITQPVKPSDNPELLTNIFEKPDTTIRKDLRLDPDKPLILLVEDNSQLREHLVRFLKDRYRIIEASNGKEALEFANENLPELVISDIMIPDMNGIELTRMVKKNQMTCHIPVILLTAKADQESKLNGLSTGADDYLVKPFNAEELLLRSENLIRQRILLKQKFAGTPLLSTTDFTSNHLDEEFLNRALKIIESNIVNSEFSVGDLVKELGLSERSAQRKLKSLTGLTPNEFIRTVRIKHAAKLLNDRKNPISQVAYKVGFSSVSYFDRVFQETMGMSPSDYIRNNN